VDDRTRDSLLPEYIAHEGAGVLRHYEWSLDIAGSHLRYMDILIENLRYSE